MNPKLLVVLVIVLVVLCVVALVWGFGNAGSGQQSAPDVLSSDPDAESVLDFLKVNLDLNDLTLVDGDRCTLQRAEGSLVMADGADCEFAIASVRIPIGRVLRLRLEQGNSVFVKLEQPDSITVKKDSDEPDDLESDGRMLLDIFNAGGTLYIENCDEQDENAGCRVKLN